MARLRIDRGLGDWPPDVEVLGTTVHACLDEVGRKHGLRFLDVCLDHVPGENWRLSDRVVVKVNGVDVREAEGLSTSVALGDAVEVLPATAAPAARRR